MSVTMEPRTGTPIALPEHPERAEAEADLITTLIMLNIKRELIVHIKEEAEDIEAQAIKLFRRLRLTGFDYSPTQGGRLIQSQRESLDHDDFSAACVRDGVTPKKFQDALRHAVDIKKARVLLSDKTYDEFVKVKSSKPTIKIVKIGKSK